MLFVFENSGHIEVAQPSINKMYNTLYNFNNSMEMDSASGTAPSDGVVRIAPAFRRRVATTTTSQNRAAHHADACIRGQHHRTASSALPLQSGRGQPRPQQARTGPPRRCDAWRRRSLRRSSRSCGRNKHHSMHSIERHYIYTYGTYITQQTRTGTNRSIFPY